MTIRPLPAPRRAGTASWSLRRPAGSAGDRLRDPGGRYELLVRTAPTYREAAGRERGVDIAAIEFDCVG